VMPAIRRRHRRRSTLRRRRWFASIDGDITLEMNVETGLAARFDFCDRSSAWLSSP